MREVLHEEEEEAVAVQEVGEEVEDVAEDFRLVASGLEKACYIGRIHKIMLAKRLYHMEIRHSSISKAGILVSASVELFLGQITRIRIL